MNPESLQSHDTWFNNETLSKMYKDLWDDWWMGQVYWFDWSKKPNVKSTSLGDWKEVVEKQMRAWTQDSWTWSILKDDQVWNRLNTVKWA